MLEYTEGSKDPCEGRCTTASDLGFGFMDGFNPQQIAEVDPQCPTHGHLVLGQGATINVTQDFLDKVAAKPSSIGTATETLAPVLPGTISPEENLPDDVRLLTNGELQSFKACRRKWMLGSYRKLGSKFPKITGAAPLGTRVHSALSGIYVPDGMEPRDPFAIIVSDAEKDYAQIDPNDEHAHRELQKEVEFARIMVEGYLEWLEETAADSTLIITAPEARVVADPKFPGLENVRLLGKLDVRARKVRDGSRVFIDHKTVGNFTDPVKMLSMNPQMLQYHLIELLNLIELDEDLDNVRTDGAIFNMLRKVKRTATAKPPFYAREEQRFNREQVRSYWLDVFETAQQMKIVEDRLAAGEDHRQVCPPTPSGDCSWKCSFYHACPMFNNGSRAEDFLAQHFVEINPLKRYEPEQLGSTN